MASEAFTFKGWDIMKFLQGRKKLLITLLGAIAGYIATQNPLLAGISAAATELLVAVIEYYVKD